MVYQYDPSARKTNIQTKLQEYKDNMSSVSDNNIENFDKTIKYLENKNKESSDNWKFNPNSHFVESFNLRKQQENAINLKNEIETDFDSNGNRLANLWKNSSFITTYDPLGIYSKKGNYEDLAWKVHRDLEDTNIFMKVLYYPKLIKEDYIILLDIYKEKESFYRKLKHISNGLVFGAVLFSWGLSYRRNFKFTSFVLLTGGTFFCLKSLMDKYLLKSLIDNLNQKSKSYAEKYPEIKYLSVEFIESPKI